MPFLSCSFQRALKLFTPCEFVRGAVNISTSVYTEYQWEFSWSRRSHCQRATARCIVLYLFYPARVCADRVVTVHWEESKSGLTRKLKHWRRRSVWMPMKGKCRPRNDFSLSPSVLRLHSADSYVLRTFPLFPTTLADETAFLC